MSDGNDKDTVQLRRNVARSSAAHTTREAQSADERQIAGRRHRFQQQFSAIVLLSLGVLVLGQLGALYRSFRERRTGGSTEQRSPDHLTSNEVLTALFTPFSSNKLEAGHVYFEIHENVTVLGTAFNQSALPILLAASIAHGTAFISNAHEPVLAIGISAYTERYDGVVRENGSTFYYRKVTSEEHLAYVSCMINEKQVRQAFSLTWVDTTYAQGKTAGKFQCLMVFVDESTTYLIRTYDSDIVDLSNGQFSMYDYMHSKPYDVELKAADVRNRRLVNRISDEPKSKTFPGIRENTNCRLQTGI